MLLLLIHFSADFWLAHCVLDLARDYAPWKCPSLLLILQHCCIFFKLISGKCSSIIANCQIIQHLPCAHYQAFAKLTIPALSVMKIFLLKTIYSLLHQGHTHVQSTLLCKSSSLKSPYRTSSLEMCQLLPTRWRCVKLIVYELAWLIVQIQKLVQPGHATAI